LSRPIRSLTARNGPAYGTRNELTTKPIAAKLAELEQKLREIDE
jgi:hypothetical protein